MNTNDQREPKKTPNLFESDKIYQEQSTFKALKFESSLASGDTTFVQQDPNGKSSSGFEVVAK